MVAFRRFSEPRATRKEFWAGGSRHVGCLSEGGISESVVFLNLVIPVGACHHPVEVKKDWDLGFNLTVLVDLVINHAADKEIDRSDRVESWKVRRWTEE